MSDIKMKQSMVINRIQKCNYNENLYASNLFQFPVDQLLVPRPVRTKSLQRNFRYKLDEGLVSQTDRFLEQITDQKIEQGHFKNSKINHIFFRRKSCECQQCGCETKLQQKLKWVQFQTKDSEHREQKQAELELQQLNQQKIEEKKSRNTHQQRLSNLVKPIVLVRNVFMPRNLNEPPQKTQKVIVQQNAMKINETNINNSGATPLSTIEDTNQSQNGNNKRKLNLSRKSESILGNWLYGIIMKKFENIDWEQIQQDSESEEGRNNSPGNKVGFDTQSQLDSSQNHLQGEIYEDQNKSHNIKRDNKVFSMTLIHQEFSKLFLLPYLKGNLQKNAASKSYSQLRTQSLATINNPMNHNENQEASKYSIFQFSKQQKSQHASSKIQKKQFNSTFSSNFGQEPNSPKKANFFIKKEFPIRTVYSNPLQIKNVHFRNMNLSQSNKELPSIKKTEKSHTPKEDNLLKINTSPEKFEHNYFNIQKQNPSQEIMNDQVGGQEHLNLPLNKLKQNSKKKARQIQSINGKNEILLKKIDIFHSNVTCPKVKLLKEQLIKNISVKSSPQKKKSEN